MSDNARLPTGCVDHSWLLRNGLRPRAATLIHRVELCVGVVASLPLFAVAVGVVALLATLAGLSAGERVHEFLREYRRHLSREWAL